MEGAGASVEGAGASVEGAGASPLLQTPKRTNEDLEASVKTPLTESAEEQAGVRKVQKVQPKLARFFRAQPKDEDMEHVEVQAVKSRHTPKAAKGMQAVEALAVQVETEKQSLAAHIADALAVKAQHLQVVGEDGSLAGASTSVLRFPAPGGLPWAPRGARGRPGGLGGP